MGGGGAMRAVAKVPGLSILTNSFRGTPTVVDGAFSVAARNAVKPGCAGLSSIASISDQSTAQKAVWEFDDWELAGSDDEFVLDREKSTDLRKVFGPVPIRDETIQATKELTDALDQVYLSSPKSCGTDASTPDAHETKACIEPSIPKPAFQAFKLLNESPAVQNVVASIACDPNVWHAVMQNPSLVEFLESEKKTTMPKSSKFHCDEFSECSSVDSSESNESVEPDVLLAFLENVTVTVVDVVQYLTKLVASWFSISKVEQRNEYIDEKLSQNYFAGGSFMALAIMVIMVVVLKR